MLRPSDKSYCARGKFAAAYENPPEINAESVANQLEEGHAMARDV
jgi:hypothetical protein